MSGSWDETLKVWDLAQGALLATLKGNVTAVVLTPDKRRATSGSEDRTLRMWDMTSAREIAVFTGDARFSCYTMITPDARFVVAGDSAGQIHMLEILL